MSRRMHFGCRHSRAVAAGLLPFLVALGASGVSAQSAAAPVAPDVTLPLPDGSVFYVRYGEPGGVRVNSRFVLTDSTQATRGGVAETGAAVERPIELPAPMPLSLELLRQIIREELAARRSVPSATSLGSGSQLPVTTSSPARGKSWLDETVGSGLSTPAAGAAPRSTEALREPASLVRVEGSQPTAAASLPPETETRDPELEAMREAEQALLTQNLDRAKAAVDSLSSLLRESRPEVIREQILEGGLFRTSLILFASGRAALAPRSREVIEVVGQVMNDFPQLRLRVEGHADARGPADRNLALSQERADSVREFLLQCCGVESSRLEAIGYGEAQPLSVGESAADIAVNRRVEFRVLNPEALTTRER